jgi:hypothetical protein
MQPLGDDSFWRGRNLPVKSSVSLSIHEPRSSRMHLIRLSTVFVPVGCRVAPVSSPCLCISFAREV